MELIVNALLSPYVGITLAFLILLALVFRHRQKMELIRTGLIKKPSVRVWRIDFDKLRAGLWMIAFGGVIAAALHFEQITGWMAFWLLVALMGVGQVLASLLGRESWRFKYSRHRHSQSR